MTQIEEIGLGLLVWSQNPVKMPCSWFIGFQEQVKNGKYILVVWRSNYRK